jgi:chorismate mutase
MADLFCGDEFTPADKLKSVERELGYRRRVYARRVAEMKMRQGDADREIAIFEAIAADYRARL